MIAAINTTPKIMKDQSSMVSESATRAQFAAAIMATKTAIQIAFGMLNMGDSNEARARIATNG